MFSGSSKTNKIVMITIFIRIDNDTRIFITNIAIFLYNIKTGGNDITHSQIDNFLPRQLMDPFLRLLSCSLESEHW